MRILRERRENGRISMAALPDKVNLSRASAYNRVVLLTRAGVITGFSACRQRGCARRGHS
jgi:Lrp/AsnC family leucine-responsive transcriptional regulator